jgi:hypothetical protein
MFWSESVTAKNQPVFDSVKCSSWEAFQNSSCSKSCPFAHMGYNADPKLTGNYYLTTNSASPYSLKSADCEIDEKGQTETGSQTISLSGVFKFEFSNFGDRKFNMHKKFQ